jgi:hypothetical protein
MTDSMGGPLLGNASLADARLARKQRDARAFPIRLLEGVAELIDLALSPGARLCRSYREGNTPMKRRRPDGFARIGTIRNGGQCRPTATPNA